MFFNEEIERALMHRNTDRGFKHNNQPLVKQFPINPKYERKIGGSNHGVTPLTKSAEDRLRDMFGEVPKTSKKIMAVNKKFQCANDPTHEIVPREKQKKAPKTKAPKAPKASTGAPKKKTKWMESVSNLYKHRKANDPSYTYKQAMTECSAYYRKRSFDF